MLETARARKVARMFHEDLLEFRMERSGFHVPRGIELQGRTAFAQTFC